MTTFSFLSITTAFPAFAELLRLEGVCAIINWHTVPNYEIQPVEMMRKEWHVAQAAVMNVEGNSANGLSFGWKRRHEDMAAHVENTALELLAKRGAGTVTVEEIAAAAGLSRRSFYRYFDSIEDILRTPMRRNLELWAKAFREQPPEEALIVSFYAATVRAMGSLSDLDNVRRALSIMEHASEVTNRTRAEMQAYCSSLYFDLISERLAARGENTRAARPVAAALTAVMFQVAEDCAREGVMIDINRIDLALSVLVTLLGEQGASQSNCGGAGAQAGWTRRGNCLNTAEIGGE
jgi:AcrR family transcriptional regulator